MVLHPSAYPDLLALLDDTAQTVHAIHFLLQKRCTVFADEATGLRNVAMRAEMKNPIVLTHGDDAWVLSRLVHEAGLQHVFWASAASAPDLQAAVERSWGVSLTREHIAQKTARRAPSPPVIPDVHVRLLTAADQELLARSSPELQWTRAGWRSWEEAFAQGIVVGALAEGRVVSIALTFARSRLHDDIAVATDAAWQSRGLSTACAATLMQAILAQGRIPVWTVDLTNAASCRVSEKLGFITEYEAVGFRIAPSAG